jgi:hypothetical protein
VRIVIVVLALLAQSVAWGTESTGPWMSYSCNQHEDSISIKFLFEKLEVRGDSHGKTRIVDLGTLIHTNKKGGLSKLESLTFKCKLKSGVHVVEFGPSPSNSNMQGMCGAHVAAWASIALSGSLLAKEDMGDSCYHPDDPFVSELQLRAGSIEVRKVTPGQPLGAEAPNHSLQGRRP